MLEKRAELTGIREDRTYPAQFELQGMTGSRVELRGYASTYNMPYEMHDAFGSYLETARSGMCARTLADGADVAYLANHTGLTLARTKSGSLTLREDDTGLEAIATLNIARSDSRDLVTAVEDGDIDEMSFGFRVVRQDWTDDYGQRSLVEVNLNKGDVSAVNYGANPFTNVGIVQRAFRSRSAADLHRMAVEVGEGNLSRSTARTLARALEAFAVSREAGAPAEERAQIITEATVEVAEQPPAPTNAPDYLLVMREQLALEQEKRRLIIG